MTVFRCVSSKSRTCELTPFRNAVVQDVHPFAASEDRCLRRTRKRSQRGDGVVERLVMRSAHRAPGPVHHRPSCFFSYRLRKIVRPCLDDVPRERARDVGRGILSLGTGLDLQGFYGLSRQGARDDARQGQRADKTSTIDLGHGVPDCRSNSDGLQRMPTVTPSRQTPRNIVGPLDWRRKSGQFVAARGSEACYGVGDVNRPIGPPFQVR